MGNSTIIVNIDVKVTKNKLSGWALGHLIVGDIKPLVGRHEPDLDRVPGPLEGLFIIAITQPYTLGYHLLRALAVELTVLRRNNIKHLFGFLMQPHLTHDTINELTRRVTR